MGKSLSSDVELQISEFNKRFKVGSIVRVEGMHGEFFTRTLSAKVGGKAVVWLKDIPGHVPVSRVSSAK